MCPVLNIAPSLLLATSLCSGPSLATGMVPESCFVLEAAAAAAPSGALLLVGGACTGKSSLSLALSLRGIPLLADGIVAIDLLSANEAVVLPSPGPVEVSQDVLDALSLPPERSPRVRDSVPRFWITDVTFSDEPMPIRAVILLGRKRGGRPEITPVTGSSRVLSVAAHSLNRLFDETRETRQKKLLAVMRILQALPVFRIALPERPLQLVEAACLVSRACGFG